MKTKTFEERIKDPTKTSLSKAFIDFVFNVAKHNGRTPTEIYEMWQNHVKENEAMDQSPTISEFLEWNKLKGANQYEN